MTFGSSQLAAVSKRAAELCLYALRVLQDGETVLALGGRIGDLGIDDTPALTELEKSATIRDLLEARSGVDLPLAVPRPDIARAFGPRPERGTHRPETPQARACSSPTRKQ